MATKAKRKRKAQTIVAPRDSWVFGWLVKYEYDGQQVTWSEILKFDEATRVAAMLQDDGCKPELVRFEIDSGQIRQAATSYEQTDWLSCIAEQTKDHDELAGPLSSFCELLYGLSSTLDDIVEAMPQRHSGGCLYISKDPLDGHADRAESMISQLRQALSGRTSVFLGRAVEVARKIERKER